MEKSFRILFGNVREEERQTVTRHDWEQAVSRQEAVNTGPTASCHETGGHSKASVSSTTSSYATPQITQSF